MPVSKIRIITAKPSENASDPSVFGTRKLDDETLKKLACSKYSSDINQLSNNFVKVGVLGVPVVDSLLNGVSQKGDLVQRLAKTAKTAGHWGTLFAAAGVVLGAKQFVNNHSKKLEKFDNNHRLPSFAIDMSALYLTYSFAKKGISRLAQRFNSAENTTLSFSKAVVKSVLEDSSLNQRVVEPFDKYISKNAYAQKAVGYLSVLAAPVMVVSSFLSYNSAAKKAVSNAQKNYEYLSVVNSVLPEKESEVKSEKV